MAVKKTQPLNFSKSFFELFKVYWGYFMTFVAATTFIWTIGVKSERKNNEKDSIKSEIVEIKTLQKDQGKKLDSILVIVNNVNQSQTEVVQSQNALRNSYVNFVANFNENKNEGLSTKDFLEYMEGLQFQLKPPATPTHDIRIEPITDTVKKKLDLSIQVIPIDSKDVKNKK